ncbi:hypothetical protein ACJX0J_025291, partial [Zea mays]
PLSASMCGPMPSPTRVSVASLPTAGAVLSCRAHRASRWPTHTRSTLHPKKPACAWEERVLDADKYAIMHCGVQVSRLHACRLSILRTYARLRAASGLHLPRVSRSSIVVYPRVARCLHAIRDTGHLRAIWDLGWRRWQLQTERYYAMPGRRLAVMLSRSPRLAGDDPRLSIDVLTSSLKPFELYAPLNAELLLELHHKADLFTCTFNIFLCPILFHNRWRHLNTFMDLDSLVTEISSLITPPPWPPTLSSSLLIFLNYYVPNPLFNILLIIYSINNYQTGMPQEHH